MMTETVRVDLGARSYDVRIGQGLLARAGQEITALAGPRRAAILTDETVAALHLPALQAGLAEAGITATSLALPAGATAENTLLGLAVIDEAQCLAFRDTGCRYCYDACPYEAIELTGEGANPHVSVLADKCNGCGACESVCVSLKAGSIVSGAQERAIVVKPIESTE